MKMAIRLVTAAVVASCASTASALDLFSVAIGSPPPERCAIDVSPRKVPCIVHGSTETHTINLGKGNAPDWMKYERFTVVVVDGVVEGILILTKGESVQRTALRALESKFGSGVRSVRTVQNRMGATFESISAQWEVDGAMLRFDGMQGSVDTGSISAFTAKGTKSLRDSHRRDEKKKMPL